jgi:hypothetical protein
MIMKMKYAVAILASMCLVTRAASVTAQQDALIKEPAKSADIAPPGVRNDPFYAPDTADLLNQVQQPGFVYGPGYNAVQWKVVDSPLRNQIALQESALAHEANEIRHKLESATTDAQRSEVRAKLSENLGKQFDLRQKRHGLEIESLEAQVKKLRELVRKRQDSREEIISRRVDQILREAEGLGW